MSPAYLKIQQINHNGKSGKPTVWKKLLGIKGRKRIGSVRTGLQLALGKAHTPSGDKKTEHSSTHI
jgi:hypothetical protein